MRIAVISDIHANLIALESVLNAINKEGYDMIFHLGDSINLGPFPAETLNTLLNTPKIEFILGSDEVFFLNDLEGINSKTQEEIDHYKWGASQLDSSAKDTIGKWPYAQHHTFNGLKLSFVHYGLNDEENRFRPIIYEPKTVDLDYFFQKYNADLIFFGRTHRILNSFGKTHYINPGSVGVNNRSYIPFTILDIEDNGKYETRQFEIPYDVEPVIQAFHQRNVPNRDNIISAYYS